MVDNNKNRDFQEIVIDRLTGIWWILLFLLLTECSKMV